MTYRPDDESHERSIEQILEEILLNIKLLNVRVEEALNTGFNIEDLNNE